MKSLSAHIIEHIAHRYRCAFLSSTHDIFPPRASTYFVLLTTYAYAQSFNAVRVASTLAQPSAMSISYDYLIFTIGDCFEVTLCGICYDLPRRPMPYISSVSSSSFSSPLPTTAINHLMEVL